MNDLESSLVPAESAVVVTNQLDQNPAAVYLAGLAPGSRPTMRGALDTIARIVTGEEGATYLDIPWHALRFQHTAAIRSQLAASYGHNTVNKMLAALRGTLKAAWKLGLIAAEDYQKAASVESVKGESVPAGRSIQGGELVALLNSCDQSRLGIRDAAILSLLYACGLRRAELVTLKAEDYDSAAGTLKVKGKRNKQRLVPIVHGAVAALRDWLAVRGDEPGPLFRSVGNRNQGGPLTTQAIWKMVQMRAKVAGIPAISPHDFRRTFVGELLDRGADIVTVQNLAGHADVSTTARYDRRGEAAKQKAAALLHVPYTQRVLRTDSDG